MSSEDLSALSALAQKNRTRLGIKSESDRILAIPRQEVVRPDLLVAKWTGRLSRNPRARPLRPAQAEIMEQSSWAAALPGQYGMVGSVGVGKGKTLAFMLMPRVFQAKRPLLLIPPDIREQTLAAEWEWGAEYNVVPTTDDIEEWRWANGELRYIVTYGQLSQPTATALLAELQPDLIMADECQNLANPKAARTMRFLRYMDQQRASVRFCPMSGTLTQAKLGDYAHLVNLALMDRSPLPRHNRDMDQWAGVLDWGAEPDTAAELSVQPLIGWSGTPRQDTTQKTARSALGVRLKTCPGFVMTTSSSSAADLVLEAEYPEQSIAVKEALARLDNYYELPDGTEVVEKAHFAANANHLSLGFYYVWDWEFDEPDVEWLEARRFWAAEVRRYLGRWAREGCDSPFLVEQHVAREKTPDVLYRALLGWRKERKKPPPPVKSVWFDYTSIIHAVAWAQRHEQCILWFRSRAVGEMLQQFGIPAMWEGTPDPRVTPRAALSINVYHKGHELQRWHEQLVLEPMPNGAWWEQLLGRTHRQGQMSEQVHASIYQHTWPLRNNVRAAVEKAEYIEATTYQPQKLLFADKRGFL